MLKLFLIGAYNQKFVNHSKQQLFSLLTLPTLATYL